MIIPIDEKTRIVGTNHAWELQRERNYKGGKKWEPYKYFPSFRQAVADAVHREIRIHPANDLIEAIEAVSGVVQKYEELIPSKFSFSEQIDAWKQNRVDVSRSGDSE